jgi:acylphosphatase
LPMKKQVHVYYSGRVQGIGLRYTLRDIANYQKVWGWVRNLDDARVEVVAEAEEDVLNSFLQQVNQHFTRYIEDVNIEWLPASGEFRDFSVKF